MRRVRQVLARLKDIWELPREVRALTKAHKRSHKATAGRLADLDESATGMGLRVNDLVARMESASNAIDFVAQRSNNELTELATMVARLEAMETDDDG